MSMTAIFYEFDKRKNSTKTPEIAGITGEQLGIVLKDPTSYQYPVMHISRAGGCPYNYLKWDQWYYYINDVVSVGNDRYEIHAEMDILATLRGWIFNTSAFVLYDTTSNSEIVDSRLSVNTSKTISVNSGFFQYLAGHSFPGGTIVAGITTNKGASFYVMDGTTADTLLESIESSRIPQTLPIPSISWDDPLEGIADVLDTIGKNIVISLRHILGSKSAAECIISAKQLPVLPGIITGATETIYLGSWNSGKSGKRITNRIVYDEVTISIPWQFSDWRRNAPYTELYLYIPYIGVIALSVGDLIGESSIHIDASLDVISGDLIITVSASGGALGGSKNIGQYSANIAGSYAIGSSAVSIGAQASTFVGASIAGAAAIASGGAAAAMAAKVGAAGIYGIMASNTPTPSSIISGGSGAALGLDAGCLLMSICHDTNVAPNSVAAAIGTPSMAVKRLGDLTGFVQTRAAEVSAPFYGGILERCNALLDGGVFLE